MTVDSGQQSERTRGVLSCETHPVGCTYPTESAEKPGAGLRPSTEFLDAPHLFVQLAGEGGLMDVDGPDSDDDELEGA